ncbi:hypothetical protein [Nocardia macrotermitis]|uniref:Uncharacterized protein n=1 Tax=Nocardia macrotermitis TaxID=2585198 RepID=A0A7K0CXN7_9NOCA|nr:hypothetical protein [Nocardia macrotermitis]MQY17702.1 hypothetical protein [Nocardia macrotermitis]
MGYRRSKLPVAVGVVLAGVVVWSVAAEGVSGAEGVAGVSQLAPIVPGVVGGIAGAIGSGSASPNRDFDPGPYPDRDSCERARARYYDPDLLECVPA